MKDSACVLTDSPKGITHVGSVAVSFTRGKYLVCTAG